MRAAKLRDSLRSPQVANSTPPVLESNGVELHRLFSR
jgi:hypothetical protein